MNTIQIKRSLALVGAIAVSCLAFVRSRGEREILRPESPPEVMQARHALDDERGEAIDREVRSFLAHYIQTLESKDEEEILDLFVSDGRFTWFTDGVQTYASPGDVLAGMRFYGNIRFETSLSGIHVQPLAASLASASSLFQTKLTIPDAEDFQYGGVITWLLEQESPAGPWRLISGHTSTPGGPPDQGAKDSYRREK